MVSRLEIRKSKETVCCCCGENKKLVELVLIETKSERVLPVLSLCEKCRKNLIATLQMCTNVSSYNDYCPHCGQRVRGEEGEKVDLRYADLSGADLLPRINGHCAIKRWAR